MSVEVRIKCRKRDLEPRGGKVSVSIDLNGGFPHIVWVDPENIVRGSDGNLSITVVLVGSDSIEVILPDKPDHSQRVRVGLNSIAN